MIEFKAVLESNTAADLLSMFDDQYHHGHELAQSAKLSKLGQINVRTLSDLSRQFGWDPDVDLLSAFPIGYNRRRLIADQLLAAQKAKARPVVVPVDPDFRERLDDVETARVVYPLSTEAQNLVGSHTPPSGETDEHNLLVGVKNLFWNSPKLWEFHARGVVVKCSDNIVVKVILGNKHYTEYTTMQYLAHSAPDIPAPRLHGLISFGPLQMLFMSFIPGTTLAHAWPTLSIQQKSSIQQKLDDIFVRMRQITKPYGQNLGGVGGEGVKAFHVDDCALFAGISTAAQYRELQFSAAHNGSKTYAKLLQMLSDMRGSDSDHEAVFIYGDIRPANIMVDMKPGTEDLSVRAIIDWEDAGFYPEWYECMALTRTLSLVDEGDWFLHVPESISPLKCPRQWLVDRLWGIHQRTT
jgi:serine/threonine protein kinase